MYTHAPKEILNDTFEISTRIQNTTEIIQIEYIATLGIQIHFHILANSTLTCCISKND